MVKIAGNRLADVFLPALSHLASRSASSATDAPPPWHIECFDSTETGVPLPPPPWRWPAPEDYPKHVVLPAGAEAFRFHATPEQDLVMLAEPARRLARVWVADARRLPTYVHGSPLLMVFHWLATDIPAGLLHAGCVGDDSGGLLLVGPGGSGKSTTCLLSLLQGMTYLSDDYTLVTPGPTPVARSLYNTGKLHRDHITRLPELKDLAIEPPPDGFEKKVIFTHQHFPARIGKTLPLRAIVLPRVNRGAQDTTTAPASAAEALKALAPSTLFQLRNRAAEDFRDMAALVRQLPSHYLHLGSDLDQVVPVLRTLLAREASA